jgi:hypothetical protein
MVASASPILGQATATSSSVDATRETLERLGNRQPQDKDSELLLQLHGQLDRLHANAVAAPTTGLHKLDDAEKKFWASLPSSSQLQLTPAAAQELKNLRAAFEAAFPDSSARHAPAPPTGLSARSEKGLASARSVASGAQAQKAVTHSNAAFDGGGASRGTSAQTPPAASQNRPPTPIHFTPSTRISDIGRRAPPAPPVPLSAQKGDFLQGVLATAHGYAQTTRQYAHAAAVYGQQKILPVLKTGAMLYIAANDPTLLARTALRVYSEFKIENQPSPEAERTCREAVKNTPFFARSVADACKTSPAVAPILAGLLDSVRQQVSLSGLMMNALFFLGGVLLGLLTGGIGLAIKLLVSVGMTVAAAWIMLKGLTDALARYNGAKSHSAERYAAIRNIGAVGGSLMLIGVMALIGAGVGKLKPGGVNLDPAVESLITKMKGEFSSLKEIPGESPLPKQEPVASASDVPGNRSRVAPAPEPVEPAPAEAGQGSSTIKVTKDVGRHYFDDGVIGKRGAGIKMAHSREKFLQTLRGEGEIVSENPVPKFDGISLIKYKLYKLDARGNRLPELKETPMFKTVVDPNRWTDNRVSALARALFGRVANQAPTTGRASSTYQVYVRDGSVEFIGWVDRATGTLNSFAVNKVGP